MILAFLIFLSLAGISLLALVGSVRFIEWRRAQTVSPVRESMRRPPGESLRVQIEEGDERLLSLFVRIIVIPVFIGIGIMFIGAAEPLVAVVFSLAALVSLVWGLRDFFVFARESANRRLGFRGERFVGGMLEALRTHGYEVYHDIPFDGFNIDHVVAGPGGVFAIETKTRRKAATHRSKTAKGKPQKVHFDGVSLRFPDWTDQWGVRQACDNARHLATRLSSATGNRVMVEPALVLPGWWVESQTNKPLIVANPKQLMGYISRRPATLDGARLQRIAYQLERMAEIEF